jgi:sporulation protein YlmC with PRC-barrel domain
MKAEEENMRELQFNIGTDVHCTDQPCGKLSKVAVEAETDRVEEIIVDVEGGLLEGTQRYIVSIDDVERASDQGVQLSISNETLQEQAAYEEKEVEKPKPGWSKSDEYRFQHRMFWPGLYGVRVNEPGVPTQKMTVEDGIPAREIVIERGTPVRHRIEKLGTVDHVLADPESGEITHIVIQQKTTLGNYVVIPETKIQEITDDGIAVDVSEAELVDLPYYIPRDSEDLQAELEERLWIEETDYDLSNVEVEVDNGVVYLSGWVLDPQAKRYAEALALSTSGVIDAENKIKIGKET